VNHQHLAIFYFFTWVGLQFCAQCENSLRWILPVYAVYILKVNLKLKKQKVKYINGESQNTWSEKGYQSVYMWRISPIFVLFCFFFLANVSRQNQEM
jgi:hypothetical protein